MIDRIQILIPLVFIILSTLGVFLNQLVISANKGKMPVLIPKNTMIVPKTDKKMREHKIFYKENKRKINFWWLSDIIRIKFKFWNTYMAMSIGDIFIYLGLITATIYIVILLK